MAQAGTYGIDAWDTPAAQAMAAYDAARDPGFNTSGGVSATGALGFGSGADVVASIGKKERELAGGFTASRTDKYAGFDSEIGCNAAGRVLDKDGGEFNTVGKQGAHDYSATEAGRFILEEKRKFEAAKAAMSEQKVRDADGTIDRVDDSVAKALMPILYTVKERCRVENINLEAIFEEAGGTHFGTIKRQNFQSTLVNNFKRFLFEEETLVAITAAYGCGYKHPPNETLNIPPMFEYVGWKDFCEDVGKAYDTTYGVATEFAQARSSWVSPIKLGMRADLVEGWDPSGSAPLIELSDSPDEQLAIETNVNPETVMAKPGGMDRSGGVERSGGLSKQFVPVKGRRASHPPKEYQKVRKTKQGRDLYGEMMMDFITSEELTPIQKKDKIVQMLDQGKNFNLEVYEDDECSSVLMEAAASGDADLVKLFLERIAKEFNPTMAQEKFINGQDDLNQTAYSVAASNQIKKLLLDVGADPKKHLTQKVTEGTFIDINRRQ